jgi:hypothetical protein
VSVKDAEIIKAALVARIEQSSVEDRDYLINMTRTAQPSIDDEGVVRIGGWVLEDRGADYFVRFRMPGGRELMKAYRANVTRSGSSWSVGPVQLEMIHGRR